VPTGRRGLALVGYGSGGTARSQKGKTPSIEAKGPLFHYESCGGRRGVARTINLFISKNPFGLAIFGTLG
jgi:hypothetical protein